MTLDKDFKQLAQRAPIGAKRRFRRLGRISLDCRAENARRRVERLIDSIEFEYDLVQEQRDRRLIIEISDTAIRIVR